MLKSSLSLGLAVLALSVTGCGILGGSSSTPTTPNIVGTWIGGSQVALNVSGVPSYNSSTVTLVVNSQSGNNFNGSITWVANGVVGPNGLPLSGTNPIVGVVTANSNLWMADAGTSGENGVYEGVVSGTTIQFAQVESGNPALAALTTLTRQ